MLAYFLNSLTPSSTSIASENMRNTVAIPADTANGAFSVANQAAIPTVKPVSIHIIAADIITLFRCDQLLLWAGLIGRAVFRRGQGPTWCKVVVLDNAAVQRRVDRFGRGIVTRT